MLECRLNRARAAGGRRPVGALGVFFENRLKEAGGAGVRTPEGRDWGMAREGARVEQCAVRPDARPAGTDDRPVAAHCALSDRQTLGTDSACRPPGFGVPAALGYRGCAAHYRNTINFSCFTRCSVCCCRRNDVSHATSLYGRDSHKLLKWQRRCYASSRPRCVEHTLGSMGLGRGHTRCFRPKRPPTRSVAHSFVARQGETK